jgi:hypothetical protein
MSDWLVLKAFAALPGDDQRRHMADLSAFVADLRSRRFGWDDLTFELQREAMVRHIDGDPTSPLWLAWARSRDLLDECEAIWGCRTWML